MHRLGIRACGWVGGNTIIPNVTICSRSEYGCPSKIAESNSVTVRRSGANLAAGRCGKQLPVICCLHLAALRA